MDVGIKYRLHGEMFRTFGKATTYKIDKRDRILILSPVGAGIEFRSQSINPDFDLKPQPPFYYLCIYIDKLRFIKGHIYLL